MPDGQESVNGRTVVAALDLGSNNCRLSIASGDAGPPPRASDDLGGGYRVTHTFSRIVRLGEGVAKSGRLSEAAMARALEALGECARRMARHGVGASRCVATAACRQAGNVDEFSARVRDQSGLDLEVISGQEEARLAVAGCAGLLEEGCDHALVFDIGGGSTELVWTRLAGGRAREILGWTSLPLGVVTVAEHYGHDRVMPREYEAMVTTVAEQLEPFEARHGIRGHVGEGAVELLGTSGTVTTIAGYQLGLARYDRSRVDGLWLDEQQVRAASARLAAMTTAERAAEPCIGAGRADLVVAGCAIMEAITGAWGTGRVRVADRGLREGVLADLIAGLEQGR